MKAKNIAGMPQAVTTCSFEILYQSFLLLISLLSAGEIASLGDVSTDLMIKTVECKSCLTLQFKISSFCAFVDIRFCLRFSKKAHVSVALWCRLKDLSELLRSDTLFRKESEESLYNVLAAGPKPAVAAIEGLALGGGLELAMVSFLSFYRTLPDVLAKALRLEILVCSMKL